MKLLRESTISYGLRIGFFREYNLKGKLISEVNEDKGYNFELAELKKKIRENYNEDINNIHLSKKKTFLGTKYYAVRISGGGNDYTEIKIHGNTGELLGQVEGEYEE